MLIFIFANSLQNGEESSAASDFVLDLVRPLFDSTRYSDAQIGLIIRKLGHFGEFALLGFFYLGTARAFSLPTHGLAAAYAGTLSAIADEFIQRFVEGRSSQVTDVIIDTAGVLFGLCLCFALLRLTERRRTVKSAS